jgi:hypothetical protein
LLCDGLICIQGGKYANYSLKHTLLLWVRLLKARSREASRTPEGVAFPTEYYDNIHRCCSYLPFLEYNNQLQIPDTRNDDGNDCDDPMPVSCVTRE